MTHYDIFNGDADGICALLQLRLAQPVSDEVLITGCKRDIDLVKHVVARPGDVLNIFDISYDKNHAAIDAALARHANVHYFDHHMATNIPDSPLFHSHIDTSPNLCTGLIVNQYLKGAHLPWAIVAAFGDNLADIATVAAAPLTLSNTQLNLLKTLGELLNYNAYGESLQDLHFKPDSLYRKLSQYRDPFDFIYNDAAFSILSEGFKQDMQHTQTLQPLIETQHTACFKLPDARWARRVSGVFGNTLAQKNPAKAHAIITVDGEHDYRVSVRAPLNTRLGADVLCSQFTTGGGRSAAAGINRLPAHELDTFLTRFHDAFAAS